MNDEIIERLSKVFNELADIHKAIPVDATSVDDYVASEIYEIMCGVGDLVYGLKEFNKEQE